MSTCQLCETRRPRRYCPGVRGEICSICCGREREVSVDCPLDCEYLQEARLHDRPPDIDPEKIPNQDIQVSESFLRDHEELLAIVVRALFDAAAVTDGAVDFDVREALDALVRTQRTLDSGLFYETRPANLVAASIQEYFRRALDEYRKQRRESIGLETIRDADVLGILVFLQRLEFGHNNGRRKGRAFLDFLRSSLPQGQGTIQPAGRLGAGSPLVTP